MRAVIWLTTVVAVDMFITPLVRPVHAETKGEWFKSLMVPNNPTASCCDVADCARALNAHVVNGHWVADTILGPATPIPDGVIVHDKASYDGEAYVCVYGGVVRCFVRPGGGT